MIRRHSRPSRLLPLLLAAAAPPLQGQAGPFEEGLRWLDGAALATPWIPGTVELAAGGELCWVGTGSANTRLLLYATPDFGARPPVYADLGVSAASGVIDVASGGDAGHLFALLQYPAPDAFHRRSECVRYDALSTSAGAPFAPVWAHDPGFTANAPARLAVDDAGAVVVLAALKDGAPSFLRVDRLDGDTGALLDREDLLASTLERIDLSGDGARLALCVESRVLVLDAIGATLFEEALPAPALSVALDRDGSRLVLGEAGRLRVLDWNGAAYATSALHTGGANETVTRVAVSAEGESYAAAWYRAASPDRLRYELYDGASGARVHHLVQTGQAGGLQNAPVAVRLGEDGRRCAFASWGKGDAEPEVVLLDRFDPTPVLELDLPGSALDVDLAADGKRLVVVTKNLHANQLGSTGEVRFYDTGERDLELLEPARLGGVLHVAADSPGASFTLFLIGSRGDTMTAIPGALGELRLDRTRGIRAFARPVDPAGRSELLLSLPAEPALIGAPRAIQGARRVQGQLELGETVLEPLLY